MTLPPLPLVDGCLFVDNSMLEALQTCPRNMQHSRLDNRTLAGEKIALNFGTAIHSAIEYRYKTCQNNPMTMIEEEETANIVNKFFEEHPNPDEEDHRTANFALEVLEHYNEKYRLEPFNILIDDKGQPMVELSFALPIFEYIMPPSPAALKHVESGGNAIIPVIYTGRIDLPVMWDNSLIIIDHKTDSMFFGAASFLAEQKPSNQYRGYCWAFEQLTGKTVDGFCVNGIRTKSPPKTKPRNQSIEEWWHDSFVRDITYLALYPNWQDKWKNDVIAMIEHFFWLYSRGEFPMWGKFTRACGRYGGCQYRDVCMAPNDEKAEEILHSSIFKDNDWSPLKQTPK